MYFSQSNQLFFDQNDQIQEDSSILQQQMLNLESFGWMTNNLLKTKNNQINSYSQNQVSLEYNFMIQHQLVLKQSLQKFTRKCQNTIFKDKNLTRLFHLHQSPYFNTQLSLQNLIDINPYYLQTYKQILLQIFHKQYHLKILQSAIKKVPQQIVNELVFIVCEVLLKFDEIFNKQMTNMEQVRELVYMQLQDFCVYISEKGIAWGNINVYVLMDLYDMHSFIGIF